jgi:hypothetical protein
MMTPAAQKREDKYREMALKYRETYGLIKTRIIMRAVRAHDTMMNMYRSMPLRRYAFQKKQMALARSMASKKGWETRRNSCV